MKQKNNDDYFKKEKPSILRSIGGLFTFTTIIPLNIYTTVDEMAKMTWIWPIINGIIGLIGAIIAYLLLNLLNFDSILVATVIYGFFIWINGFNHLDGLIDFGDGIMVHGSPSKKLNVMRDPITGVGGIATLFVIGTMTIAAFNSIISPGYILLIIIAEMCAKVGLLTACVLSRPSNEGIGKYFIKYMNMSKYLLGVIMALVIAILIANSINPLIGVFAVIGGMLGGFLVAAIAQKHLGFANGDVLGSSNEIGRLCSLLAMIITITALI